MDILLLVAGLAIVVGAVWKWTTKKTTKVSIAPTEPVAKVVYPPAVEVSHQPIVEMAVTDGEEEPVKRVRKPRAPRKTVAKKVVKKTRAKKTKPTN